MDDELVVVHMADKDFDKSVIKNINTLNKKIAKVEKKIPTFVFNNGTLNIKTN